MTEAINRDDAGKIAHRLTECRNVLQKGNVFSCLLKFKEVLEKISSTNMIPADEKALQKEINDFQKTLAESKQFRDIYGPVTFRDNEIAPTLELMKQLIEIKSDEMTDLLEEPKEKKESTANPAPPANDTEAQLNIIKTLIENGNPTAALELLKNKDDLAELLAEAFNTAGIEHRRAGSYDESLQEFKKALVASPRDEGIYYNMARVYIAQEEWKTAAETINEGLKINHDFAEGIKLLKYIRETGKIDS
ncbi:MAG: tetratricopeptide repeat protein [Syntrophales bacterium]|nr:tetratricopeptide repeat protein [Syntrophales bacterium]